MLNTLNNTCTNRFRSLSGGPRHWLFVIIAITVQRSQESASEHDARLILHIGWFISMLTDLAGPRFGGCVTSQCLTIETHSQTGTVRHGDDPLLVGRDRPVEQPGSKGVRVLVELQQVRVGYGSDEVEVCRQAHRGGEHVRHAGQASSHCQRRDPPASGYAPRPDYV